MEKQDETSGIQVEVYTNPGTPDIVREINESMASDEAGGLAESESGATWLPGMGENLGKVTTSRLAEVLERAEVAGILKRRIELLERCVERRRCHTGRRRLGDKPFAHTATKLEHASPFGASLGSEQRRGPFKTRLGLELGTERDPAGQIARQRHQVREALQSAPLHGQRDKGRKALAQARRRLGKGQRQLLAEQRQIALALQCAQAHDLFRVQEHRHVSQPS